MSMTYTTKTGATYNCHTQRVENGFSGKFFTIWVADNFAYYADTYEELCDLLDYWTIQWKLEEKWNA